MLLSLLGLSAVYGAGGYHTCLAECLHCGRSVAAYLSGGMTDDAAESTRGNESTTAAALPGHRGAHWDSAVAAAAAARVAVALGTDTQTGCRGRGRLPSLMAGCAELACRARSRAALYGARRGPDRPCVKSASDDHFDAHVCLSFFSCLFLSYSLTLGS